MLSQFFNIDWDVTNVMLVVIFILGIILVYKSIGMFFSFFYNIRQSKNTVNKEPIKKANKE